MRNSKWVYSIKKEKEKKKGTLQNGITHSPIYQHHPG
jgi:hypothetical protein